MSLQLALAFVVTVLVSVGTVAVIILLGWFLLWKAFLSKFKLVRELFGLNEQQQPPQQQDKTKLSAKQYTASLKMDDEVAAAVRARPVRGEREQEVEL